MLLLWETTHQGSSSLDDFLDPGLDAVLTSRDANRSFTEDTIESHKLRPKDGVLKESMKDDPKSPIVINFKNDLDKDGWGNNIKIKVNQEKSRSQSSTF